MKRRLEVWSTKQGKFLPTSFVRYPLVYLYLWVKTRSQVYMFRMLSGDKLVVRSGRALLAEDENDD